MIGIIIPSFNKEKLWPVGNWEKVPPSYKFFSWNLILPTDDYVRFLLKLELVLYHRNWLLNEEAVEDYSDVDKKTVGTY